MEIIALAFLTALALGLAGWGLKRLDDWLRAHGFVARLREIGGQIMVRPVLTTCGFAVCSGLSFAAALTIIGAPVWAAMVSGSALAAAVAAVFLRSHP